MTKSIKRPPNLDVKDLYKNCAELNLDVYVNMQYINFYLKEQDPMKKKMCDIYIDSLEK